tara:strand:+ start:1061 stop:1399 length:339 start_codon:yes stop_codon:yes gene_type:complete
MDDLNKFEDGLVWDLIVGHIAVDAGLCWVGDPCYVLPDDGSERNQVKDWETICDKMAEANYGEFYFNGGHPGLGVCVATGLGDGFYPVTARFENGLVKSITVTFLDDDDEED